MVFAWNLYLKLFLSENIYILHCFCFFWCCVLDDISISPSPLPHPLFKNSSKISRHFSINSKFFINTSFFTHFILMMVYLQRDFLVLMLLLLMMISRKIIIITTGYEFLRQIKTNCALFSFYCYFLQVFGWHY